MGAKWHLNEDNEDNVKLNYLRCDYLLEQCKLNKLKIIGALFWDYNPDCIVIPDINLHLQYIKNRKMDVDFVLKVRQILEKKAKNKNIPVFDSCLKASQFIEYLESKNISINSRI